MSTAETTLAGKNAAVERANPGKRALISFLILVSAGFPLFHLSVGGYDYWLHMLLFIFMNIAIASSWNIIGGYAGYISLGHNVFFAIGGYASAILFAYYGISPFISAPVAGVIAMFFALIIGMVTLRARGPTFIISTVALVLLAKILLDNWDYIGGASGLSLPLLDLPVKIVKLPFYYYMLA